MPPVEKLRLPSLLPTVQCISPTPDVAVTHATVECNRHEDRRQFVVFVCRQIVDIRNLSLIR